MNEKKRFTTENFTKSEDSATVTHNKHA